MKVTSTLAEAVKAMSKRGRLAAALLTVLMSGSALTASATVYTLEIPSTQEWTDTGIDIAPGSLVGITASGMVQYGYLGEQVTDANGGDYTGQQFFPTAVLPDAVIVSLIGKIGGTTAVGTGTPLPEGAPGKGLGFVGTSYSQFVSTGGRLFLGFNDQLGTYYDNYGSFSVNISVVPEPSTLALLIAPGALLVMRKARRGRLAA